MLVTRGFSPGRTADRGSVVAIGNFDGLHLGHQAILEVQARRAREAGLRSIVLTFEPHAREYFSPQAPPARLMRLRDKAEVLARQGVDELRVLRFAAELSAWDGVQFIERILDRALQARRVVVGEGFRYGHDRSGDASQLRSVGARFGLQVDEVPPCTIGGRRVSSTHVRQALAAGELREARLFLGHDYRISGRVMVGTRLGRQLGFPTANIRLHRKVSPVHGIFAVRVSGAGLDRSPAVASVGTRPTVGGVERILEVYLFDFDDDLYGRRLAVDFIAKLRDEKYYPDLESMTAQMNLDARWARDVLGAKG